MDGLKKITLRLIAVMAFSGFVFIAAHWVAELVLQSRYEKVIEQDIAKLAVMVENENVLSTDELTGVSMYEKFVKEVIRMSEDHILKYNVEVNQKGVTESTELGTSSYIGANADKNPIQIYYLDDSGNRIYIDSYVNCPNRGTVIYIELTGSVYVPVMSRYLRSKDQYSQSYSRKLVPITKKVSVISSNFYKGK